MQTNLSKQFRHTPLGEEADAILRSCVHCGFCTATCPTYQLLGDELDGPRGRIYLIKQMLEGDTVTVETQRHLDRCLTCRACETTCPSGVRYGRLADIGREVVEQRVSRSVLQRIKRWLLRKIIAYPSRFRLIVMLGRILKPVTPKHLRQKIPARQRLIKPRQLTSSRSMLLLAGCAQQVTTPRTNQAAQAIFAQLGVKLLEVPEAVCCGSLSLHLAQPEEARDFMRRNIDVWWPYIEKGAEAIVVTASGCGTAIKDYGELLKHDTQYAEKAQRISELAKDLSEVLQQESIETLAIKPPQQKVAFHSPCTLQHGQQLHGVVENILTSVGFKLVDITDAHLCCGSAGTYSILQAEISQQLLQNKLANLQQENPDIIATANVGCQLHLETKARVPVKHWVELIYEAMS